MRMQTLLSWTRYHAARHGLPEVDGTVAAALAMQPGGTDEQVWRAADAAIRELVAVHEFEIAHPEPAVPA